MKLNLHSFWLLALSYSLRQKLSFQKVICIAFIGLLPSLAQAQFAYELDGRLQYNEVTWLMAHNAHASFNNGYILTPNQTFTIQQQLDFGVRGFAIDTYSKDVMPPDADPERPILNLIFAPIAPPLGDVQDDYDDLVDSLQNDAVYLLHNPVGFPYAGIGFPSGLTNYEGHRLKVALTTIGNYLLANEDEIVTIVLENYASNSAMQAELNELSTAIRALIFQDYNNLNTSTLNQIRNSGKRLIILANDQMLNVAGQQIILPNTYGSFIENTYSDVELFNPAAQSCTAREESDALTTATDKSYIFNHFLLFGNGPAAATTNNALLDRLNNTSCTAVPIPNFIHVDHVELGTPFNGLGVVRALNRQRANGSRAIRNHDWYIHNVESSAGQWLGWDGLDLNKLKDQNSRLSWKVQPVDNGYEMIPENGLDIQGRLNFPSLIPGAAIKVLTNVNDARDLLIFPETASSEYKIKTLNGVQLLAERQPGGGSYLQAIDINQNNLKFVFVPVYASGTPTVNCPDPVSVTTCDVSEEVTISTDWFSMSCAGDGLCGNMEVTSTSPATVTFAPNQPGQYTEEVTVNYTYGTVDGPVTGSTTCQVVFNVTSDLPVFDCPATQTIQLDANGQVDVAAAMSGVQTSVTYEATGDLQQFTVPPGVTELTITAAGAEGGRGSNCCFIFPGGKAAVVTGTFAVTPGDQLQLIVGEHTFTSPIVPFDGGGGGGGTFVAVGTDGFDAFTPAQTLLVGGGGGGFSAALVNDNFDATTLQPTLSLTNTLGGAAGTDNGFGGPGGGGGGGLSGDGANDGAPGGKAAINGAEGGPGDGNFHFEGGFGGGGARRVRSGGGGGGAAGGNGSDNTADPILSATGGTSYNGDPNGSFLPAAHRGSGYVTITYTLPADITYSPATLDCSQLGTQTITASRGTDCSYSCTFDVTVEDNVAPDAVCQNVTVQLDAMGNGTTTAAAVNNGSTDACGIASMSLSKTDFTCANVGDNTVTLTVTDVNGNSNTCTATVTVEDNVAPTINSCSHTPIIFNGEASAEATSFMVIDATDACGIASITHDPAQVTCDQAGTIVTITTTVTDVNGQSNTCTTDVEVSGLPCDWIDTGGIGCTGGSGYDGTTGEFTVTANGCQASHPYMADENGYIYQELCGDGSITALITGVAPGSGYAGNFGGVMMRETTDPGSKLVAMGHNGNTFGQRRYRVLDNYPSFPQYFYNLDKFWVKIERTGYMFRGYVSADGQNWYPYLFQAIQMQDCILAGLYADGATGSATFTNVSIQSANPPVALAADHHQGVVPSISQDDISADPVAESTFKVYPNPTSSWVTLEMHDFKDQEVLLTLTNGQGQIVKQHDFGRIDQMIEQIDLSGLPAGMYLLQLNSPDQPPVVKRIAVQ